MSVADPTVWPALEDVLAAMRTELAKVPAGAPAHFRMTPGLSPVFTLTAETDECCEGVAWLRVVGQHSTMEFPAQQQIWEPEGEVSWTVILEIGVGRCGGGPGPDMAPTDAQYTADTKILMDDAAALRRVGPNLKATSTNIIDYMYTGSWEPVAAEANCMGGLIQLAIQVAACDAPLAG